MNAGNHNIHLGEYVIGQIEAAIRQNVDLNSGEDCQDIDLVTRFANLLDVSQGRTIPTALS
jgi:hypothetical protein